MAENETYVYLEGASGLRRRVPLSKVSEWKARQEELRKQGISKENTIKVMQELNEKLKQYPVIKKYA